jgi:hypothetical protein
MMEPRVAMMREAFCAGPELADERDVSVAETSLNLRVESEFGHHVLNRECIRRGNILGRGLRRGRRGLWCQRPSSEDWGCALAARARLWGWRHWQLHWHSPTKNRIR